MSNPVSADIIVNATESGGNVIFEGGGSFNLNDLTFLGTFGGHGSGITPYLAVIALNEGIPADRYTGFSGPLNFGLGDPTGATSGTGDAFYLAGGPPNGEPGWLMVPEGYQSGTPLFASVIFEGESFASMGLVEGSYTWTWGTGANADSYTLNIGSIPEPGGFLVSAIFLIGCVGLRRRKLVC